MISFSRFFWVLTAFLAGFSPGRVQAQALPNDVTLVPFYSTAQVSFVRDSARTVGMWEVPGKPQHFFVMDQRGLIYSLYPDTTIVYAPGAIKNYSRTILANFRNRTKQNIRSEMGSWSLAFHPNFAQNRYFYVLYFGYNTTVSDVLRSDGYLNIERWTVSANYAQVTRDTTIFREYHPASYGVSSHAFGPDGYLYVATSVYSENGWDTTSVFRKILRLDVNTPANGKMYSIPAGNPFANSTNPAVRKEIWASGLRNVWSMSFDFQSGKLWAGDVGQDLFEEINLIQPGRNYGWANGGNSEPSANGFGVQGMCPNGYSSNGLTCANLTNPDWVFPHSGTPAINCISVGPAFRGAASSPFYGYHFVTDVWRNQFWAVREGSAPQLVGQSPLSITSNNDGHNGIVHITEDSYGNLYASIVSWYFPGLIGGTSNPLPSGQSMFHEIYMLEGTNLTPRTTPTPVMGPGLKAIPRMERLIWNAGGTWLEIPKGFSGAEIYNLRGKKVWSGRGGDGLRLPAGVEHGALRVRLIAE